MSERADLVRAELEALAVLIRARTELNEAEARYEAARERFVQVGRELDRAEEST